MNKIGMQEAKALLKHAGASIRSLVEENKSLVEKVASFQKKERIEKIAREMEVKNLSSEMTFEEKVAALSTAKNLDVKEEAIKMATPQGFSFGSVGDKPSSNTNAFEAFIVSGEDPGE
jgi:hypothetical protein